MEWQPVVTTVGAAVAVAAAASSWRFSRRADRRAETEDVARISIAFMTLQGPTGEDPEPRLAIANVGPSEARNVTVRAVARDGSHLAFVEFNWIEPWSELQEVEFSERRPASGERFTVYLGWFDVHGRERERLYRLREGRTAQDVYPATSMRGLARPIPRASGRDVRWWHRAEERLRGGVRQRRS